MNKYTFIALEGIASDMGDAYIDGRLDDVATLADELMTLANEIKYTAISTHNMKTIVKREL